MTISDHQAGTGSGRDEGGDRQDAPAPSHAERARTLAERARTGCLSTLAKDPPGHPYGSLVAFTLVHGAPVLLLSTLAEHTRNLMTDPRASLLIAEPGEGDALARGRVTLLGRCARIAEGDDQRVAREAFLAAHPDAARYIDFEDFALFRLEVEAVRYIGGFGRMSWIDAEAWQRAEPDPIAASAAGILAHMRT